MIDTTPKFDPIPRLQQIAATIEESGADIFDAPATAVHYIECAIKEIERLRQEHDEARREVVTMTPTGESAGAGVIIGRSPETPTAAELTAVLLEVRDLLKSREGASLILDYRVRRAVFAIETILGGIRHGS